MGTLSRYRRQMLALDSALTLTRGSQVGLVAILTNLHPRHGSFTAVAYSSSQNSSLIGQMHYRKGDRSARLSYLLPECACETPLLMEILDGMARQAGEWGALNLLADLEETSPAFDQLRRAGFSVYAWQRIWRLDQAARVANGSPVLWQLATPAHEISVRSLAHCLVPSLVQRAVAIPGRRLQGFVLRQVAETLGYVECIQGGSGVFLQPLIHPSVQNVPDLLASLLGCVAPRLNQPVYLAVHSYQGWLEPVLESMQLEVSPRRALLVKHLAGIQRIAVPNYQRAAIETTRVEPTAPILQQAARTPVKHR
ncbi:MAG: hypothetical protein U1B80_03250 [Anaerolineaceae bacterium]|nr:hypothetical protein [Anaerolineaceae bacterium]